MKSSSEYSAFISYASDNRDKAEEICASLEGRGLVCWMAPRNVRAGREYADEIIQGLERSAAVVLVLSQAANTSVFVLREIERAVAKDINVVPVRIEEVTPSPGLELFISGTHWLDVWRGNWDDHMDRLVRDLDETPAAARPAAAFARRRAVAQPSSLRSVYVAAGLVLLVGLSGIAILSSTDEQVDPPFGQDGQVDPGPRQNDGPTPVPADLPPASIPKEVVKEVPAVKVVKPLPTPDGSTTAGRGSMPPPALTVEASTELNALTDDYDDLSLRGGVTDDALNQLWEEMKPNSPRLDMVTHQRSLRTNLTRIKDALAQKDAAGARRYLDRARADLAVLEQFLNRR